MHNLYKDGDKDIPEVITDSNGQVTLGLCKDCGRAEIELIEPCVSRPWTPNMPIARVTNISTPESGTVGPIVATVELTREAEAFLREAAAPYPYFVVPPLDERDEADDLEARAVGRTEPVPTVSVVQCVKPSGELFYALKPVDVAEQNRRALDVAASAMVVAREALKLIELAKAHGVVVTIDTVPLKPLAMGNYEMRALVRAAR